MLLIKKAVLTVILALPLMAIAQNDMPQQDGVSVGKPSALRNLVPAEVLERQSSAQYDQLKNKAASEQALVPEDNAQTKRLRAIAAKLIPFTPRFNPRAKDWNWEVNLIASKEINAFCMPGGKIAFYTGLLNTLKLTDDEVAMVMGHEIAHALREHARAQMAKSSITNIGANVLGQFLGNGRYTNLFQAGGDLLGLKFSRNDESEADVVGLDLAARAGYDPRAGIRLWEKMSEASKNNPPQWLSTHPSGTNRINAMQKHMPEVLPLYAQATGQQVDALRPYGAKKKD
ncbi:MAG: M48 family metallopeptidase [Pseudomonadota bacterium]